VAAVSAELKSPAGGLKSAIRPPVVGLRALSYGGRNYNAGLDNLTEASAPPSSDEVRVQRYAAVGLAHKGGSLTVAFGSPDGASQYPVRLRYKLEGYDPEWRDLDRSFVHLVLKYLDENKVPVSRAEFRSSGNSVGWTGDLAKSELTRRTEQVVVPSRAAWMDIWIDSGGHDENTGVWLVDDLKVWELGNGIASRRMLLDEGFENGRALDSPQGDPEFWVRDGGGLAGSMVWKGLPASSAHALMILDGNPSDYAAWRLKDKNLLPVVPGKKLELKWSEVYSIGCGRAGEVSYPDLPSGHYQFRVQEVTAMGIPTGQEAVLPLIIAPPFYTNIWFRAAAVVSLLALALGLERMRARNRMRRKLEAMERKQAVQQERARIARDIHDDLGTVLSRISMVSESAALETQPGSRQQERLNEICDASRQLTRTMEEIVWAQDPKHDSLENTVSYICSFASDLLAVARITCRLDISMDLPGITLEAEKRHELFLVFKEVLNNIIKHAGASEVRISLEWQEQAILLTIEDNGRGFSPADSPQAKGNGLSNMQNRLQRVNGRVEVHTEPGKGTRVEILLPLNHQTERIKSP